MTDVYSKAAEAGAKFVWQLFSAVLPQVAVWSAASTVGGIIDWALRKKAPAVVVVQPDADENAVAAVAVAPVAPAAKNRWTKALNPLANAIKKLNPLTAISFAVKPFTSIAKGTSWFAFEVAAHHFKDKTDKIFNTVAPIAEGFFKPFVETVTTPFINFLQNNGLMQLPKSEVVCPVSVCEPIVALPKTEVLQEAIRQASRKTVLVEETGNAFSRVWTGITKPLVNLYGNSAASIPTVDTSPVANALREAAKEAAAKQAAEFAAKEAVLKAAQEATLKAAAEHAPQGIRAALVEQAEHAGNFIAQTTGTIYNGANKFVHAPAKLTNAVGELAYALKDSSDTFADTMGIPRGYIYAAEIGATLLMGFGTYCLGSSLYSRWGAKAKAEAKAQADAEAQANLRSQIQAETQASLRSEIEAQIRAEMQTNVQAEGGKANASGNALNVTVNMPGSIPMPIPISAAMLTASDEPMAATTSKTVAKASK